MATNTFDQMLADLEQRVAATRLANAAPDLLAAVEALTILSVNGRQICFRSKNDIPMGMSKKQERIVRAALAKAKGT